MTAPAVVQQGDPFEEYRKKFGGKPQAQDDFAAYRAQFQPQEPTDTAGFSGGKGAGGITEPIPMAEGLMRAGASGLTLGGEDELAGLTAKVGGGDYAKARDVERERYHAFKLQHPWRAGLAEFVGSLPLAAARLPKLGLTLGSATYGGLSSFLHGEGDTKEQAKRTGFGALLGGALGKVTDKLIGRNTSGTNPSAYSTTLDRFNPKRIARRDVASVLPEDAAATFAARKALVKGATVPGDLSPETAALSSSLGKNLKTAITGRRGAVQRIKEVKGVRKATGAEYDALERMLPVDEEIQALAARAGSPLPEGAAEVPFSMLHRLRHDVGKMRASGMAKHDIGELREGIDNWLQQRVEGLADVDARYRTLTTHLGDALKSLSAAKQGAVQAAKRSEGGGTRQGNRMLSVWHALARAAEPSPAKKAAALQNVAFNPATAQREMGKILSAEQGILRGPSQMLPQAAGAMAGGVVAPQLSNDTTQAHAAALQLRSQGATDAQLAQQLSQMFTPNVVRFIVAKTPQRLAQ